MAEMKTLNGYEVVDAKARADIEKIPIFISEDYYTKTQIDNKGYLTEIESHNHTLSDITDYVAPDFTPYVKTEDLDDYYTKEETNSAISDAISAVTGGGSEGGLPHYNITYSTSTPVLEEQDIITQLYNKTLVPDKNCTVTILRGTSEAYPVYGCATSNSNNGTLNCYALGGSYRQHIFTYSRSSYVDGAYRWVVTNWDDRQIPVLDNVYNKTEVDALIPSTEDFATKEYVDGLFEGIATAEGGSY